MNTPPTPIEQFLDSVRHQLPAYRHSSISFESLVHEGYETIVRASLLLATTPTDNFKAEISISDLRVAQVPLSNAAKGLGDLLGTLASGEAALIGSHMLKLHPDTPHSASPYYEKSSQINGRLPRYRERLFLNGLSPSILINPRQPELDRLLQSHAFDSLSDLLREYDLEGIGHNDRTTFEIIAGPAARIEEASQIQGDRAEIFVLLARDLPTKDFQLTVRNADRREDSKRRTFGAAEFTWTPLPDCHRGVTSFSVPKGSILEARALFAGHVQDSAQLADPSNLPNPRRRRWSPISGGVRVSTGASTAVASEVDVVAKLACAQVSHTQPANISDYRTILVPARPLLPGYPCVHPPRGGAAWRQVASARRMDTYRVDGT